MKRDLPLAPSLRESWQRSTLAGVSPSLRSAALTWTADELAVARDRCDWVETAQSVLAPHLDELDASEHMVALFDERARMLTAAGDPFVLHRLDDIHFVPGADWSEAAAGTNGPGTALASGRPVHVVGAEHFCQAWQPWHCAAVPLHSPAGDVLGALDVSGPAEKAGPWALRLAQALGLGLEQALRARAWQRRATVLGRYAELAARYPGDVLVALDCEGLVLQATGSAKARGLPSRLRLPPGVSGLVAAPPQAPWLEGAAVFPVVEEGARVGACLLVREGRRPSARRAPSSPASTRFRFDDVVGAGLAEAVALARAASTTEMPVLLVGESGVGKELLAQAVHEESPRRGGPFVAVNCGALPRDLVESELFGYAGGAFSGARSEGAIGRFEAAHGGTLFLDEVGELPLPAQAALLRVLQEKVVTPIGGAVRSIDVRIVSATNRDLEAAVRAGTFRLDLLHRLNVIAVTVPPLRARPGDLPELVDHLAALIEHETGLAVPLPADVRAALTQHDWPGNVRELDNVLRRLAVLGRSRPVTAADLPFAARAQPPDEQARGLLEVIHSAKSMAEAAARLGINRSTLYRQLERLGLRPGRTARPGA